MASDSAWPSARVRGVCQPLWRGRLGTDAVRGDAGGLGAGAGASPTCCPGLSLWFPLLHGAVISKSGVCLSCYILPGAERQEEIPASTLSHSSREQSSISPRPTSVPTNFFENLSPCPACSFANIPSPATYKTGLHHLITEVKLVSRLPGEAGSSGAVKGQLEMREDAPSSRCFKGSLMSRQLWRWLFLASGRFGKDAGFPFLLPKAVSR